MTDPATTRYDIALQARALVAELNRLNRRLGDATTPADRRLGLTQSRRRLLERLGELIYADAAPHVGGTHDLD